MLFTIVLYAILLIAWLIFVYGIYKLVWYFVKMLALNSFMKDINKDNVTVIPQRKFSEIVFGKKCSTDYIIDINGKRHEITVNSFVSTHGRWNIEKTRTSFFVESRRASAVFFGKYVNSNQPDHVVEYKGESRVSRKELFLIQTNEEFDKQILLLYPYPARITYTDAHYHELFPGDKVEGRVIMKIDGIKELIDQAKQAAEDAK